MSMSLHKFRRLIGEATPLGWEATAVKQDFDGFFVAEWRTHLEIGTARLRVSPWRRPHRPIREQVAQLCVTLGACPKCAARPFQPFLRGQVGRSPWPWWAMFLPLERWRRPSLALICWACKQIVGYE